MSSYSKKRSFKKVAAKHTGKRYRAAKRSKGLVKSYKKRNRITAGLLGLELKYWDTGLQAQPVRGYTTAVPPAIGAMTAMHVAVFTSSVGASNALAGPPQGDGPFNREGRKIHAKSIHIQGLLDRPAYLLGTPIKHGIEVFIALVLDKQANGVEAPNSELIWINPSGVTATVATPMRNMEYATRFKVLKEKRITLDYNTLAIDSAGTQSAAQGFNRVFEWFVPLDLEISFNNTNASDPNQAANIQKNALHLYAIQTESNATVGTQPAVVLSVNSRLRFYG